MSTEQLERFVALRASQDDREAVTLGVLITVAIILLLL